jgi:hypothetical protein
MSSKGILLHSGTRILRAWRPIIQLIEYRTQKELVTLKTTVGAEIYWNSDWSTSTGEVFSYCHAGVGISLLPVQQKQDGEARQVVQCRREHVY